MTGKLATAMAVVLLPVAAVFGDMWGDFVDPPDSAKPWAYYLWQNGLADRETITADLEAMKRLGFGKCRRHDVRSPHSRADLYRLARRGRTCKGV